MIPSTPPPNASEIKTQLSRSPLDIPIVHTLYDAYHLLHAVLLKFPKSERYTLGQTCGTCLLKILEHTLAAGGTSDTKEKIIHLRQASTKLDVLRILFRLAKDCDCVSNNTYLELESKLHDAGRMLGGWMKSLL